MTAHTEVELLPSDAPLDTSFEHDEPIDHADSAAIAPVMRAPSDAVMWRSAPVLGAPLAANAAATRESLFRPEALAARQSQWLGEIQLTRSLRSTALAYGALALALVIVAFLIFGEYTRSETVTGEVQTSSGTAKVLPLQAGVVVNTLVQEGQQVSQGQPMFLVSLDKPTAKGATQANILQQLAQQKAALREEQQQQQRVAEQEQQASAERLHKIENELGELTAAFTLQQRRTELAQNTLNQYRELAAQNYYSQAALNDKVRDVLDNEARLSELKRQRSERERDRVSLQNELRNLPLRAANQRSTLTRQIQALESNSLDTEMRREFIVPAPHAGTVTAILAHNGQVALPNQAMASVLPQGAKLEVNLYAASRNVGFIRVGSPVLLRYEAFPYQKFGQYAGTVAEVSRSAIAPAEMPFPVPAQESLYRIRVSLASPSVLAYGKNEPLQSGMRVEAKVRIDTRKLYEWVLEPLYSLKGFNS